MGVRRGWGRLDEISPNHSGQYEHHAGEFKPTPECSMLITQRQNDYIASRGPLDAARFSLLSFSALEPKANERRYLSSISSMPS